MLMHISVLLSVAVVVVVNASRWTRGGYNTQNDADLPNCVGSPAVIEKEYEEEEKLRRASDMVCPQEAVCANVWDTVRDWFNGTRCRDHRTFVHCTCPGGNPCPVGNEDYAYHSNKKSTDYMCEPKCSLDACSTRHRAAMEMVQNSPDFRYHNYYRINCRCPGHHFAMTPQPGRLIKSTSFMGVRYNFTHRMSYTQYRCSYSLPLLTQEDDPCKDGA